MGALRGAFIVGSDAVYFAFLAFMADDLLVFFAALLSAIGVLLLLRPQ